MNKKHERDGTKNAEARPVAEAEDGAYGSRPDKYELMARRFVAQYPITKYIPRSFYADNCTLRPEKDINVVFIGFGRMNSRLFGICAMQFQFAVQNGGGLQSKPVHYYICDRSDDALRGGVLSRIVRGFDEDFGDCDFPRPERICDVAGIIRADIASAEVKERFSALVTADSFTYFVVSLGDDTSSVLCARAIKGLLPDGGNFRIFARTECDVDCSDGIICFGAEEETRANGRLAGDLSGFARRLDMLYNGIGNSSGTGGKSAPVARGSMPAIERASNLYHALALPFKLGMLGFGLSSRQERGVAEEEFDRRYVNTGRDNGYADPEFFFGTQSSNVLAFTEHSRWNALYFLSGYRQMKKRDIVARAEKDGDGTVRLVAPHKNIALRQHACLTTYYGLRELIEYKFSVMYPGEDVKTVPGDDARLRELYKLYRYDYMDLDGLYGQITAMGYKIEYNF